MPKLILLFLILSIPGILALIRALLSHLYQWQIKEYRLDRMFSYLRYEKNFSSVQSIIWLVKLVLLIIGLIYVILPKASITSLAYIAAFILYFIHLEWFVREIFSRKLIKPRLKSIRNLIIIFIILSGITFIYLRVFMWFNLFNIGEIDLKPVESLNASDIWEAFKPTEGFEVVVVPILTLLTGIILLTTLLIDVLMPLLVALMIIITNPIAYISRLRIISAAKNKIRARGDSLKIVALTGSYGKTTTKELIYDIVSKKYITAKTPENKNTAVGVAQSILKYLKNDTQVIILEMGAYKKGEISESTKIARPDIAVVTALSNQHLSLFGGLEKLYQAKFELIEGTKPNGVAIFNGNDEKCQMMASETKQKKVFFYHLVATDNSKDKFVMKGTGSDVENENIYVNKVIDIGDFLDMEITYKNKTYPFKVALKDARFALNLVAAMSVALQLGFTIEELINIVKEWRYNGDYLNIAAGLNRSRVILDVKSSNFEGFKLAIDFLNRKGTGNKWIMTQGIIELGTDKKSSYAELAKNIVNTTNGLITSDWDLIVAVREIKPKYRIVQVNDAFNFINAFKFNVKEGDTVLIEGAFSEKLLNQIVLYE